MVGRKRKLKPNFTAPEWLNVSETDDDGSPSAKRQEMQHTTDIGDAVNT